MNFDIRSKEFWDPEVTRKELLRVFDVCHGCRVCDTYCPSFVHLFQYTDENAGDVYTLSEPQIKQVVDECYQCKLCYVVCPYVPNHEWDIDYPRMIMRAHIVDKKETGFTMRDRMLGDIDLVGKLSSLAAPVVNWVNQNPKLRELMEKHFGIHKDRILPTFHAQTFETWSGKHNAPPTAPDAPKAALFYTCLINYNEPQIGRAAVAVMENNGIECAVPAQECCGLPFLDSGMTEQAVAKAEANVARLAPLVKKGYKIVVPSASCSYTMKLDYPNLVPTEDSRLVAANTMDLSEYLVGLHAEGKLAAEFTEEGLKQAGKIRYHQPCHLKAQNMGFKGQELMAIIPGAEVKRMQACSGHDGSWSVKKEYFEMSMTVGKPLFKFMKTEDCCTTTDCPLSAIQVEQATGKKPIHPIEVLARAYGVAPPQTKKGHDVHHAAKPALTAPPPPPPPMPMPGPDGDIDFSVH
ncbi:MAG: anaerobic glycerol-3-phosphate dehydrogenase subunit C [Acidobacteria bacterium]|nr:anaerobic glycerol-3-phosphate dehydrogenase subunit C [Acidobacteriota bacterium]